MSREEHETLQKARDQIQRELEEEIMERLRKIKRNVLDQMQGASSFSCTGNFDLRKKYASMTAAEVVLAVYSNTEGVFSSKMTKVSVERGQKEVQMFCQSLMQPKLKHYINDKQEKRT